MKLRLQEGETQAQIKWGAWQTVLHGEALDERGRCVLSDASGKSSFMRTLKYLPDKLEIALDSSNLSVDDLQDALRPLITGRVLLEATTLGLAELALCCRALRELGQDAFDIVYVEPDKYSQPNLGPLLNRRDFELSSEVPGYKAIPGSALLLGDRKPSRSVFFVGYEDARLRRAFEELQMLNSERSSIAIGVPGFKAGWEMPAMANNISVIREHNIRGGVHYCGADDPFAVYELLCEIYQGLQVGERLILAPIGTKPHGIGVSLFAALREDVGIIYDHPNRSNNRTSDVGHWHLFTVEDFQSSP